MKLTTKTLKKIIQEELNELLGIMGPEPVDGEEPLDGKEPSIEQLQVMCANGNKDACDELDTIHDTGGYKYMERPGEQYDPDH